MIDCQRNKNPLIFESKGLLPILERNAIIRISPEMDAVWPGGDHLMEFQYDLKWKEIADPSTVSFSLQGIRLTPGKTYWWLWAYDGPGRDGIVDENDLLTSSMNWGKFKVKP